MRVFLYSSGLGPKIPLGEKTSTIRGFTVTKSGRRGGGAKCKVGDVLSHRIWTGLAYRSPQIELCRSTCKAVKKVRMELMDNGWLEIYIGDAELALGPKREFELARQEGFTCIKEMKDWFINAKKMKPGDAPFEGELTEW